MHYVGFIMNLFVCLFVSESCEVMKTLEVHELGRRWERSKGVNHPKKFGNMCGDLEGAREMAD